MRTPAHYNKFTRETMAYIAMSVSRQFHNVPIFAALGNNDAYCDDYDIRLQSGFLSDTAATFRKYFLNSLPAAEQNRISRSFMTGGFFDVQVPGTKHRIIMLNSVPFMDYYPADSATPSVSTVCDSLPKLDVVDEFERLEHTIGSLPTGSKAWITCHVPPGIDPYSSNQSSFWNQGVRDEFLKLYLNDANLPKLSGVLAAHSHMSEFKLIRTGPGMVGSKRSPAVSFVLLNSSVTRNHSSNPSFRLMTYERDTLRISDYTTHYLDFSGSTLPMWRTLSFQGSYAHDGVTATSLDDIFQGMVTQKPGPNGMTLRKQYARNYDVRAGSGGEGRVISKWTSHYQSSIGSVTGK